MSHARNMYTSKYNIGSLEHKGWTKAMCVADSAPFRSSLVPSFFLSEGGLGVVYVFVEVCTTFSQQGFLLCGIPAAMAAMIKGCDASRGDGGKTSVESIMGVSNAGVAPQAGLLCLFSSLQARESKDLGTWGSKRSFAPKASVGIERRVDLC